MQDIFIVEDSSIDYQVIKRAFEESNFTGQITRFVSGELALEELMKLAEGMDLNKLPKLIISDINMPGCDGFEFCRTLADHDHLLIIPVVMMSNSNSPEDIKKVYQSGAKALLNKRVDFDEQVKDIKALIDFWLSGVVQTY